MNMTLLLQQCKMIESVENNRVTKEFFLGVCFVKETRWYFKVARMPRICCGSLILRSDCFLSLCSCWRMYVGLLGSEPDHIKHFCCTVSRRDVRDIKTETRDVRDIKTDETPLSFSHGCSWPVCTCISEWNMIFKKNKYSRILSTRIRCDGGAVSWVIFWSVDVVRVPPFLLKYTPEVWRTAGRFVWVLMMETRSGQVRVGISASVSSLVFFSKVMKFSAFFISLSIYDISPL